MSIFRRPSTRRAGVTGTPSRRYVFIVTYARSGSSVLQSILASIPGSHITGENDDALAGLFATWRSAQRAQRGEGSTPRTSPGDPWRGAHRIDASRYNRKLVQVFVDEILQPPADAWLVGFKEVRYFDHEDDLHEYLDYIRLSFQPALLVFNRRRATDVAGSGWWKTHPSDIATEVERFDQITSEYCAAHPKDTMVVVYDEWVAEPELLRSLFDRLGARLDLAAVRAVLATRLTH